MYTGATVSSLTPITSNDDAFPGAPGGFSLFNQAVHSNVVYAIAVDGYGGASGSGLLTYSFVPATLARLTASVVGSGTVQVAVINQLGGQSIQPTSSVDVATNSTVVLTPVPSRGYQFDSWIGAVASFNSPLTLTVTSNVSITANFVPIAYSDDFESGNLLHLPWITTGNAPWIIETTNVSAGQYAARSGVLSNNQTSSLRLTTNFASGFGSFDYRISSELNFDFLKLFLDGTLVQKWSGEAGWTTLTFPVPSGTHTLEWRYTKDPNGSAGLDAAFIDNVILPIVLPKDSTTPAQISWVQGADGSLVINVAGQTNQQYILQVSVDLVHWRNFASGPAENGFLRIDPGALSNPVQFYRAVVP